MIQRKHTLGFMDIMRGKYKLGEPEYISKQLRGMTPGERERLLNDNFDSIWNDLWGVGTETSHRYMNNRKASKQKLTDLRNGVISAKGVAFCLADLLRQEPALFDKPEWGFPKGRREIYESDIQCAYRELNEETGICENDIWKVTNVAPLVEQFYGSNNIHYRHTYYIAQYVGNSATAYDSSNSEMTKEIGDLAWKNLDEAILLLRPENLEKRGIVIQLANLLQNFSPIIPWTLYGQKLVNENAKEEQQDTYVFTKGDWEQNTRKFFGRKIKREHGQQEHGQPRNSILKQSDE